jgi:hypothetical protein
MLSGMQSLSGNGIAANGQILDDPVRGVKAVGKLFAGCAKVG